MIRLAGVGHVYSQGTPWARRGLEAVDLSIGRGDGLLVAGANGSGKTTLAWILAGMLVPTEGVAELDGEPLHQAGPRAALAFQHARLQLFRPTVGQDVAFGTPMGDPEVDDALRTVGLDPVEVRDRRIDALSGGQQRRVALAGLIARRPELLVLDEPFSGLDAEGRATLVEVLGRLRTSGLSVVVVSHDYEDADRFADRVVVLESGRMVFDEPTAEALHDGRLFAALEEAG
ncbi:MAG TPA: ABC transporter ATP-binding protein [Acidimicrobiales bacterium]|nr:ABC transporter ATP-binding protein [Acidimicrobiales bacterium]